MLDFHSSFMDNIQNFPSHIFSFPDNSNLNLENVQVLHKSINLESLMKILTRTSGLCNQEEAVISWSSLLSSFLHFKSISFVPPQGTYREQAMYQRKRIQPVQQICHFILIKDKILNGGRNLGNTQLCLSACNFVGLPKRDIPFLSVECPFLRQCQSQSHTQQS